MQVLVRDLLQLSFQCRASLQLQQAHYDEGEFHQVPQRETEGLSAQRGAVPPSATGPD